MGNYNPYLPFILGDEWVPIRNEDVTFSPAVNSVEYGHQFILTTSKTLQHGKFYSTNQPMYTGASGQAWIMAVYPVDTEGLSGPVQRVVIPCTNATATGAGISPTGNVTNYLQNPSSTTALFISSGGGQVDMSFGISLFPILNGKRILRMNFLYLIQNFTLTTSGDIAGTGLSIGPNTTPGAGASATYGLLEAVGNSVPLDDPLFTNIGDINRLAFSNVPSVVDEFAPWNYPNLLRLEPSAPSGLHFSADFRNITTTTSLNFNYAALELFYCEEQRVAAGCRGFIDFGYNFNRVTMRTVPGQATNPVLAPGRYTVTVSPMDPGNYLDGVVRDDPPGTVDGLRELYPLPLQAGMKIALPFPLDTTAIDKVFDAEESLILPQLSLHTSGGTIDEVHAYGRQAVARVFGSVTATQEIFDSSLGAASYPQVRYYARRFGETTVPLLLDSPTITGAGMSVQITPTEFDALDEIIAGWKEVTLRFTTAPTMGTGTNPQWRWSAIGELAGNRWEVLGAIAPALSGLPGGNIQNQVPVSERLTTATYGALTAGSTINLGWIPGVSPVVTATTDDPMSDATLIFSQDPLPITGFSVATATQEMVGIGLDCGIDPCCIPTDILYNRITWGLPVNTGVASDNFNRVVAAGGWGTASDGHVWTTSGTAANFSVDGAEGLIIPTATASDRIAWVNVGGPDQNVQALVKIADTAETSSLNIGLVARLTDASNYYIVEFRYDSTGTTILMLRKRVAGVATDLNSMTVPTLNPNINAWRYLRLAVAGNTIRAKVWGVDEAEPDWMLVTTDSSLTTGNNAGLFGRDNTTAAAPSTFMYDSFTVGPPTYWFGAYELQRMDTIDTDWQTIMRATNVATTGFSDFEARVGVLSSYRIRGVNVYDFAGPWSSTVSITIPSPGASGSCLSDGHMLMFTSNERQDGSINLAYSTVWEDRVQEDFTFAEAGFVQLQAMYNRDFFTAFHPTERGGEQFQRNVLVQAAAISPPTLADFTSLRDMAWDDVSYICVRDEEGNRWFATVLVPSGRVVHFRKVYIAAVTVIEVTDTPSEVDP